MEESVDKEKGHYQFYTIRIKTGEARRATTHRPKVFVQIEGQNSISGYIGLSAPKPPKKIFKKGTWSLFYVIGKPIDSIKALRIRAEGTLIHNWLIEEVEVYTSGVVYRNVKPEWVLDKEETVLDLVHLKDQWVRFGSGKIILGPILKFRGTEISNSSFLWKLGIFIVTHDVHEINEPLTYTIGHDHIPHKSQLPIMFYQQAGHKCWRYDFEIELSLVEKTCTYSINGVDHTFQIPALDQQPRMVFGSCLDRELPFREKCPSDRFASWRYLSHENYANKYHLFILGGDQVYADQIFSCTDEFATYNEQKDSAKSKGHYTETMDQAAKCFYFNLYIWTFNQGLLPSVFAKIPTILIWDDHDIYDGYGSLQPEIQHCPVYKGLFEHARNAFFVFQRAGDYHSVLNIPNNKGPFTTAYVLTGGTLLLSIDLRTERDMYSHKAGCILSENSWNCIENWLNIQKSNQSVKHLFVVCTTPVIYPHRKSEDKVLDHLNHELVDDARDQWPAYIHLEEQTRLVHDLVQFSRQANAKVTILTGDVHLGACGTVRDDQTDEILMDHIISSGMGAKAPGEGPQFMFKHFFKTKTYLQPNYRLQMEYLPNGKMFLPNMNFITLHPISDIKIAPSVYKITWFGVVTNDERPIGDPLPEPVKLIMQTY